MHYFILFLFYAVNAYGLSPLEALYKENDCGNSKYNFSLNKVAVLDTGFDKNHPLLKNNLKNGWNVIDGTNDIYCEPKGSRGHDHGTHVAGIISQIVSPHTSIIPFKIAPAKARAYDFLRGLKMISEVKEISLVNLSWDICRLYNESSLGFVNILSDAIKNLAYKGKMVIVSAGNGNSLLEGTYLDKLLKDPKIKDYFICVGAIDNTSTVATKANFSNTPGKHILENFMLAPGVSISSSVPDYGMGMSNGTSMAVPMVTGALAKLMEEFNISNLKAREILFKTATKNNKKGGFTYLGVGVMNFPAARRYLIEENIKSLQKPVVTPVKSPAVVVVKQKPAVTYVRQKPIVTRQRSTAVRQRPMVTRQRSTAVRQRPMVTRQRSTAVRQRPMVTRQRSTAVRQRPMVTRQRPIAARQKQAAALEIKKKQAMIARKKRQRLP